MSAPRILIFGGSGAIGRAAAERFGQQGWRVSKTSRRLPPNHAPGCVIYDPASAAADALDADAPYDAVVWAQGANATDSVFDVDPAKHLELYQANCVFVLQSLQTLLTRKLLARAARLVVVSSIWQRIARQNKLSYIMTKAAIGGLVQSAAVDLAAHGFLINAVLPSAIDTPMTQANLTPAQQASLAAATGFNRLVSLDDVVAAIEFLASPANTGMSGQSLTVDLGFSHARLV